MTTYTAEEYHALPRLSASGIKKLLVSAQDFWVQSWMNPNKRESESEALNLGTAYHTRVLEGEAVFKQRYAVKPECDRRTKEGKEIYAAWLLEFPGAKPIDADHYSDIMSAKANDLSCFQGGKAEVSLLWDDRETNVPMKARLDYLLPGYIYDFKTFSNSSGMELSRLIARHVVNYGYHIQAATYNEAIPGNAFSFVFQQTGQANNCIMKPFSHDLLLAEQGRKLMRQGINKFASMYERYGTAPWYDEFATEPFKDEDFPLWSMEA